MSFVEHVVGVMSKMSREVHDTRGGLSEFPRLLYGGNSQALVLFRVSDSLLRPYLRALCETGGLRGVHRQLHM